MKRVSAYVLALLISAPMATQAPASTPAPAHTVKLADHLYEITMSAGSPIGVKVLALGGAHGVLLADSATAETAPAVRAALDALGTGLNSHLD